MNLLNGVFYDPAVAVSKATTALLAMTALDTTNLRVVFTVPPSGKVWVRIKGGCIHGATTYPMILVGILEGATVKARQAPLRSITGTALATTQVPVEAEFLVTGLTPGASLTWDLAYGVEIVLAATGWKYGGPNNTTTNDAFGGISFEVWDPSPNYTPAATGVPPTTTVHQKLDTIDTVVDAVLVDTDVIGSTGQGLTSLATQASVNTVDTVVDAIKLKTDNLPSDPADASDILAALAVVDDFVDTEVGAVKAVTDKLDTALELDGAVYRFTTNALEQGPAGGGGGGLDAAGVRAAVGLASANLDTQLAGLDGKLDTIDNLVDSEIGAIGTDVDDIQARLPAALVGGKMNAALDATERAAVADKVLGRNIAGGSDAGRKVHEALAALRNRWEIAAGVLTVYDEDDVTPLFTAAVTRSAGDPITQMDPA